MIDNDKNNKMFAIQILIYLEAMINSKKNMVTTSATICQTIDAG